MIKIINNDVKKNKLSFVIEMPIVVANAIRRSALEIPIMAIEDVEIINNDSALYDEMVAHRLGLVPIETTKASKEVKFRIKAKGPKVVYSSDIEPSIGTNYRLPITILDNEQELEIVAEAKLGRGIDHIKFSPGLIYYKHNVDENLLDFITIDDSGKVSYDEEDLKNKEVTPETLNKIKKLDKVEELRFEIESWGQIEPKEIFLKAIEVLENNLEELNKSIG